MKFTNTQNSKLGIDCVVAYEVVKVAGFFIVYSGGQWPSTRILNFFIFRKKERAMELLRVMSKQAAVNNNPACVRWINC